MRVDCGPHTHTAKDGWDGGRKDGVEDARRRTDGEDRIGHNCCTIALHALPSITFGPLTNPSAVRGGLVALAKVMHVASSSALMFPAMTTKSPHTFRAFVLPLLSASCSQFPVRLGLRRLDEAVGRDDESRVYVPARCHRLAYLYSSSYSCPVCSKSPALF